VNLNALINAWTHGWRGFALAYAIIGVFMIGGLKQARANWRAYLLSPVLAVPTMVVSILVANALVWMLEHWGKIDFGRGEMVVTLAFFAVGGFVGGLYWANRGRPLQHGEKRGALVFDGTQAQRETRKFVKKSARNGWRPITLAGVALSPEDELKHTKLLGTTGTGKSTVIREALHAAIERGDRAVIADPDGGYLSRFYTPERGDVILNPFDARSRKWDLFAELRNRYDADELAEAFIPNNPRDPTWPNFGRTLFSSVVTQAHAAGIRDVSDLYRLLVAASQEELQVLLDGTAAAPLVRTGNEKVMEGARSTITTGVKSLAFIREQTTPAFSVREWIKTGKGVLFLPYQADQIASLRAQISIWMRLAIFQTMSLGEGDHRLWFAVDELDALGAINGLPDALARLRKFGGRCLLGLQSIAQASTNYGDGPAQTLIENTGNTLILRCSASEGGGTARYASKLIGDREVVRMVKSIGRSRGFGAQSGRDTENFSEQTATEAAVMASEIEQLPDRAGFVKVASQPGWMRVSFPVYELPKTADPFVPVG